MTTVFSSFEPISAFASFCHILQNGSLSLQQPNFGKLTLPWQSILGCVNPIPLTQTLGRCPPTLITH